MLLGWNFGVATCFLRKFYFCWFYAICLLSGHYIVIAMFNLMIPRNIIGRISGLGIVQKMQFWSLNWHNSIGDLTITFFIFLFKLSDIEAWIHNLPNCIFYPNWHKGWYFYLLVIFGSDFLSWIFIKSFQTFLEVKIDINWVNLAPSQAYWVL